MSHGKRPSLPGSPVGPVGHLYRIITQVSEECQHQDDDGFDAVHDDQHIHGELGAVAAVLAHPDAPDPPCGCREAMCPHTGLRTEMEPIPAPDFALPLRWKHDRRRQLVIAAAMILREIQRLDRVAWKRSHPQEKTSDEQRAD